MNVLAGRVEAGVLTFPVLQEVKAAIPTEGVAIADLVKVFKTRLEDRTTEFIALVQQAGRQDGMTWKIVPKDQRSYRRYDNMQELAGDLAARRYRDGFYWVLLAAIESSMRGWVRYEMSSAWERELEEVFEARSHARAMGVGYRAIFLAKQATHGRL
ncbi:transcription factor IIF subunit tfg1 [Friedmanniomyces endolithicus]|nr:transcription factor IIF subunit tfg1 [Friedmanniomyces endolithicus]